MEFEGTNIETHKYLKEKSELTNLFLKRYFNKSFSAPPVIEEAMRYSLLAGGKRLRPVLAMASYEACGGKAEDIVDCASAIEVIHTYSLIHDDLPAMDNDDLRRGRPTNHKVFGDAVAILAGDGLLTEAFLMILNAERFAPSKLIAALRELSLASGVRGMVGGQVQDILSENVAPDVQTLLYIHSHKTGALIRASVRIGGILAGADGVTLDALTSYGEDLGLAFQIVDDILDVKGDPALLGKPVGSDSKNKKLTYPALYGVDVSFRKAEEHIENALGALKPLPESAAPLRGIAKYILQRKH